VHVEGYFVFATIWARRFKDTSPVSTPGEWKYHYGKRPKNKRRRTK
jgi:hypothetical protein